MEVQFPRRRVSAAGRDDGENDDSRKRPVPPAEEKKLHQATVEDNEECLSIGVSNGRIPRDSYRQPLSPAPLKRQWRISVIVTISTLAVFMLCLIVLVKNENPIALIFGHEGSSEVNPGIEIPLHPEQHIYRPAADIEYHWSVSTGFRSPDGVKKRVYLINSGFPGPTLELRSGDTLRIHVSNDISDADEGLAIHWHGLSMHGSNDMDGAVGFTQCPIRHGGNFTYEFYINEGQSGTFWYHAHSQLQRADGLYGGLVVHRPVTAGEGVGPESEVERYGYRREVLIMVGDWYHRSAEQIMDWYLSTRSFGNEPVPDSLLINGAGKFDCAMAAPARPIECTQQLAVPRLSLNNLQPVRFRIINTGSLAGFTIRLSHAKMLAIHVDGGNEIEATEADSVGIVYPGERVDVIARWDSTGSASSTEPPMLYISLDTEDFAYPNPSLVSDQSFPVDLISLRHPHTIRTSNPEDTPEQSTFDLQTAHSRHQSLFPSAEQPPKQILLYTTTMKLSRFANIPKGFMNHTSWAPQSTPHLPLLFLNRSSWDEHQLVPYIKPSNSSEPAWVDITLNNLDDGGHPFHMHGYEFYILSTHKSYRGWGSFNPFTTSAELSPAGPYDLVRPLKKDTVFVPRRGYVVLRFRADNEGIWMFHCHILWHQASGMAMGFQVGGDEMNGMGGDLDGSERTRELCDRADGRSGRR